jgi:hypothetical protein
VQAGRTNDVHAASLRDRDKFQHAATRADGHRVDHRSYSQTFEVTYTRADILPRHQ